VIPLGELIVGLPVAGPAPGAGEVAVGGVAHDSRRVEPGDLFVAWKGARFDGAAFAREALAAGAVAVLASAGSPPPGGAVVAPWLTAADPHALLAPLAARAYRHPDRELTLVGVTGTNGKSTVAALCASILAAAGMPAGLLGTLGYAFGDLRFGGGRTTPEASDLFRALRRMRDAGAAAAAMEVSSHALALGRVGGATFDAAVFTNLTRDHLDFHRDLDDYFAAKRRLFAMLKPGGRAAVNLDDPYGARLAGELPGAVTFSRRAPEAAVRVLAAEVDESGIRGAFATPRGELAFSSPLLGAYNLDNLLAAAAASEALDLPLAALTAGIAARGPVPGRMERVEAPGGGPIGGGVPVYVDYAHTPAALEAALRALKGFSRRKVVLVFGCGGDRDAGKREPMGRLAGELAELPIVTSDNPRSEDPLAIISAVERGLRASGNDLYRVVPDRREAIRRAVAVAGDEEWAVLIAGKGDERVQIVGVEERPFDDRAEARTALEEKHGQAVRG
jgi:UDP-N-acetylmuramoyl-L-alanyl-D-glutamate--2,6-diaminopimelate ligase